MPDETKKAPQLQKNLALCELKAIELEERRRRRAVEELEAWVRSTANK
jgi:hypothetical protein